MMQIECTDSDPLAPNRRTHNTQVAVERRSQPVEPHNLPASSSETASHLTAAQIQQQEQIQQLEQIQQVIQIQDRVLDVIVTEGMAAMAIRQLRERKQIATPGAPLLSTRHEILTSVTGVGANSTSTAVPLVAVLARTMADERLHANAAMSLTT